MFHFVFNEKQVWFVVLARMVEWLAVVSKRQTNRNTNIFANKVTLAQKKKKSIIFIERLPQGYVSSVACIHSTRNGCQPKKERKGNNKFQHDIPSREILVDLFYTATRNASEIISFFCPFSFIHCSAQNALLHRIEAYKLESNNRCVDCRRYSAVVSSISWAARPNSRCSKFSTKYLNTVFQSHHARQTKESWRNGNHNKNESDESQSTYKASFRLIRTVHICHQTQPNYKL